MKLLKKITVKNVHGKKPAPFEEADAVGLERCVMTCFGRADKATPGEFTMPNGDISEYIKFYGSFAAYPGVMSEGDEFRSGVLIMPAVAADMLAGLLAGEEVTAVNFGFAINIRKTETSVGFEYTASPLMEDREDTDPLAAIAKQVLAALPKPKGKNGNGKGKGKAAPAGK